MKHIYFFLFLYIHSYAQQPCLGIPTVEYGGKAYHTVQIGNQCWLKENLDVGTRINGSADQKNNGILEKYCYNDNLAYCAVYGGLYQWDEAMQYSTTGTQGICPTGWHIPTGLEFQTLNTTVSNDGNALKAIGQGTGSGAGTNTSGFSALLAGDRSSEHGLFFWLGGYTYFWISTNYDATGAIYEYLYYNDSVIAFQGIDKAEGFSVRCLKDISTGINDLSNNILPNSVDLFQNFPNPFNPNTVISYSLPSASNIKLIIYNTLGQTIKILENGYKNAGNYSVNFNAADLPSGIYFYKLEAGQFTQIKKMMVLK
jgi:uncharacterized protein (TIGR02145 family)